MRSRELTILGAALAAIAMVAVPGAAEAGKKKKKSSGEQRVIEFACGTNDGSFSGAVPGDYATSISALNLGSGYSRIRAKVVLTVPESLRSDVVRARIRPGQARVLDCDDLLGGVFMFPDGLPAVGEFFQGFLVVENTGHLNVSVKSSAGGQGIASAQTETVDPRPFKRKKRYDDDDDGVEVCHVPPGNPDNAHTIEIGEAAVDAHLRHGDYRGECDDDRYEDDDDDD